MGRPSDIDTVVGQDDDGHPITVADRILNGLRAGAYIEQTAAAAGIAKKTYHEWLRIAGRARIRTRGDDEHPSLTDHEHRCIAFSDAVTEAQAQWELGALSIVERIARGGIESVTTTVAVRSTADGTETTTTTRTEHTLPSLAALLWRLERKFPQRYGRKPDEDDDDENPMLLADRVEGVVDAFSAYLEGVRDAEAGKVGEPVDVRATIPPTKPRRARKPRPPSSNGDGEP